LVVDESLGWLTRDVPETGRSYVLDGRRRAVATVGTNHEDITESVLEMVNSPVTRFGEGACKIVLHWCAEIDRWKGPKTRQLVQRFPELLELDPTLPYSYERSRAEQILHSWGGVDPLVIGIRIDRTSIGELTGGGAVGFLLRMAAHNFNAGSLAHGLRLLGISLHTIQDFYAHHVQLQERERAAERERRVVEDDPSLAPWRWREARRRSAEQMYRFVDLLTSNRQRQLATMSVASLRAGPGAGREGLPTMIRSTRPPKSLNEGG